MGDVSLTFEVISNRTVDVRASKNLNEKTHYTTVLSCCADRTKLPLLLIYQIRKLNVELFHVHPKGLMDEEDVKLWLQNARSYLVWNQFRTQKTKALKEGVQKIKKKMAVIPGCLTSQLRPLGVSIKKPFKKFMKEERNQRMRAMNHNLTLTNRLKMSTILRACEWVLKLWNAVKIGMKIFYLNAASVTH